jgi:hypothetical protein
MVIKSAMVNEAVEVGRRKRRVNQAGDLEDRDGERSWGICGHLKRATMVGRRSKFPSPPVLKVRVLRAAPLTVDRMCVLAVNSLQTDNESRFLVS